MRETWYVMEDGSAGDPRDVRPGEDGRLRHSDGRSVAYRSDGVTPRSRGVDVGAAPLKASPSPGGEETDEMRNAVEIPDNWRDLPWPSLSGLAAKVSPVPVKNKAGAVEAIEAALKRRTEARDMKPAESGAGYKTRESKAD